MLRHDGKINNHPSTRRNNMGVDLTPQFFKNVHWDHVCRPCIINANEKEKAEREKQGRLMAVQDFKRKSNIKPKYEHVTFDNFSTTADKLNKRSNAKLIYGPDEIRSINRIHGIVKDWAGNFKENRKTGKFMTFLGNPGTGKTHLACAAINRVIEHNCCSALIMSVQTIFMNIKKIYSEKGDELGFLERLANLGLLVIEEVGIQKDSDWEFEKLNWIISERVDRLNPTIVISNLDASDFEGVVGSRMWDRLCGEDNETLMFDWRSFR